MEYVESGGYTSGGSSSSSSSYSSITMDDHPERRSIASAATYTGKRRNYYLRISSRGKQVYGLDQSDEDAQKVSMKTKKKTTTLSKYRRKTANSRERDRMREVNEAFENLRQVTPELPEYKGKLTKITTLTLAINYIKALRDILGYVDEDSGQEAPLLGLDNTEELGSTTNSNDSDNGGAFVDFHASP